jgi:hypothetical protein
MNQIKVLHYGYTRSRVSRARWRFYSVTENIFGTASVQQRLWRYRKGGENIGVRGTENTAREWFEGWERLGIDMQTVDDSEFPYHDVEVLIQFGKHGMRRFWLDDIWDNDWEAVRLRAIDAGIAGVPEFRIEPPPWWMGVLRSSIKRKGLMVRHLRSLVRRLRSKSPAAVNVKVK